MLGWMEGAIAATLMLGFPLYLRWQIGRLVDEKVAMSWEKHLQRQGLQLEALKQQRALAAIAAKQAEDKAGLHG